ncbi:MAG: glycosyltransferase [bacterium]|nr:glycosyltransferase [bacterium]
MAQQPVVAHCANPFLPLTMVWMYDQLRSLKRYRAVVLTQGEQNREAFPFEPVYSSERLSAWRRNLYRAIRKVRGTYAGYGRWLRQEEAVVMHAHFGQEGYRCLEAAREMQIPLVTTFYGMDVSALPRQAVWQRRFRRLFAEGDLFLAEGPCMGENLVGIGCPTEKVCIQKLGVDLEAISYVSPEERSGASPVVLTYAAFREKKGLVYALRAFQRVCEPHPEVRMRMIGDGLLRGEIEAEIGRLGLGDRVILLGMQSHEASLEELGRAAVLLYPSVTASDGDTEGGAPVGLIEAMASGVPVVSSIHADIPHVVPDGQCGLLFPEKDVAGLAEGLDFLLGSAERRAEMGREGRKHVEVHHNLRRQGEHLEGIYDRVRA